MGPEKFEEFHKNTFEEAEESALEEYSQEGLDEADNYLAKSFADPESIAERDKQIRWLKTFAEQLFDDEASPDAKKLVKEALEQRKESDRNEYIRVLAAQYLEKYESSNKL